MEGGANSHGTSAGKGRRRWFGAQSECRHYGRRRGAVATAIGGGRRPDPTGPGTESTGRRGLAHFSAGSIVALRGRVKAEKCACPLAARNPQD